MIIAAKAATGTQAGLDYRWVAVGNGLWTSDSTDLTSWTSRTSSFGATSILAVASNGSNLYVAVGEAGKLATSPDGITWTQRTSSFGTTDIRQIAYGEGVWVAAGDGAAGTGCKVATSTDGITWTQRTVSATQPTSAYGLSYGAGSWFLMGNDGVGARADDPTGTWTPVTTANTTLTKGGTNTAVLYASDQSIWVAGTDGGTTGALASTTTASLATWTARTSALNLNTGIVTYCTFVSCGSFIAMGGLLVTTNNFDIQTSTNGTTWTDRASAWTDLTVAGATDGTVVAFVSNSSAKVQTSSNGTTWTNQTTTGLSGANVGCLAHSSGLRNINS